MVYLVVVCISCEVMPEPCEPLVQRMHSPWCMRSLFVSQHHTSGVLQRATSHCPKQPLKRKSAPGALSQTRCRNALHTVYRGWAPDSQLSLYKSQADKRPGQRERASSQKKPEMIRGLILTGLLVLLWHQMDVQAHVLSRHSPASNMAKLKVFLLSTLKINK